ncbi:MAG: hypothetical protein A2Y41_05290 [Spirochaetes bacterium GWB1_36_13]|nr:MAG: hypothetical protein A2Y41_05290 [Spirochaetes bacterium GWB1_36_13]
MKMMVFKQVTAIIVFSFFSHSIFSFDLRVLCYHNVVKKTKHNIDVSSEEFEKQMNFLASNGYISLKASELVQKIADNSFEENKKYIVITFDDGNLGVYKNAFPILKKYNLKATLYIYPSIIMSREKGKHLSYMNWDEINMMLENPLIELGSHSYYHPYLTHESEKGLFINIQKSKEILKKKTGISPLTFAYPFGIFDSKTKELLKKYKYTAGMTIIPESVFLKTDLYQIPRFMIYQFMVFSDFKKIVTGEDLKKIVKKYYKYDEQKTVY